jgi:hypothetical protein
MLTIAKVILKYNSLDQETRIKLQDEFGQRGISDRERKFYSWLKKNNKIISK